MKLAATMVDTVAEGILEQRPTAQPNQDDIVEAFMYCASSGNCGLQSRPGMDAVMVPWFINYRGTYLQFSLDDLTLTAYLTKVTKLWNELSYLAPTPQCTCRGRTCGVNKAITDLTASAQLMQFLMGLYESYNSERSQILMQDLLPNIEKAFSMVEDEKLPQKKKTFVDKKGMFCTHCRKTGYSHQICFQLHGVPEWYKTLNDKKKKGKNFAANVDGNSEMAGTGPTQNVTNMMPELLKVLQDNTRPTDPISNFANYVHLDKEFVGTASKLTEVDLNCCIIDSEATNHICSNIALFHSYNAPATPHFVYLPDGSKKAVQYTGPGH
ncbi:UNVERIFIED_CONTAM: hypothetical protein Slati_4281700 [Sesamum latifolium]|uniref:Uncharacterized protein n=1 Tax=Sesamum latifolium TaxID=2727402 RepID=A0AAW2TD84_9LAMI